jgi:hypothetical protein
VDLAGAWARRGRGAGRGACAAVAATGHLARARCRSRRRAELLAAGEPPRRLGPSTFERREGEWIRGIGDPPSGQPITLRLLEPGRHLLSVAADGYRTASLSVLVAPGEVTDAEVFLQAR